VFILMIGLILACGQSKADIAKYTSETQTASPAKTPILPPTSIVLNKESIVPLLFQSGDFPAGFSSAQVRNEPLYIQGELPASKFVISQQLAKGANAGGGVTVYIFQENDDVQKAYEIISYGLPNLTDSNMAAGEKSSGESKLVPGIIDSTMFAFTRCSAAIYIQMDGMHDLSSIVPYVKNLDKRLTPIVCQ
jgi:hypothetical protein